MREALGGGRAGPGLGVAAAAVVEGVDRVSVQQNDGHVLRTRVQRVVHLVERQVRIGCHKDRHSFSMQDSLRHRLLYQSIAGLKWQVVTKTQRPLQWRQRQGGGETETEWDGEKERWKQKWGGDRKRWRQRGVGWSESEVETSTEEVGWREIEVETETERDWWR